MAFVIDRKQKKLKKHYRIINKPVKNVIFIFVNQYVMRKQGEKINIGYF